MEYTTLVRRVATMLLYGMTRDAIRDRLLGEGLSEESIFFAYVGASILTK